MRTSPLYLFFKKNKHTHTHSHKRAFWQREHPRPPHHSPSSAFYSPFSFTLSSTFIIIVTYIISMYVCVHFFHGRLSQRPRVFFSFFLSFFLLLLLVYLSFCHSRCPRICVYVRTIHSRGAARKGERLFFFVLVLALVAPPFSLAPPAREAEWTLGSGTAQLCDAENATMRFDRYRYIERERERKKRLDNIDPAARNAKPNRIEVGNHRPQQPQTRPRRIPTQWAVARHHRDVRTCIPYTHMDMYVCAQSLLF